MPFPLLAGLALKAAPLKAAIGRIPRGVWIAVAVVAILLVGSCVHKRKVKAFGDERYAAGVAYEQARLEAKAKAIKAKADAASAKITEKLRTKHDETVTVIYRDADALRLRGPGKAACPGYPGVSSGPSGSNAASGRPDVAGDRLPVEDRIALPFAWTVDNAERCDLNRAEVLTWREWHRQQSEAWAKIK